MMNDIAMAVLFFLLAIVLAGILIILILLIFYGILDIVGDIVDWFVQRFGK